MKPVAFAALLLAAVPSPSPAAQPDSFDMPIVAYLPMRVWMDSYIPCGDLDRDGFQEVYAQVCTTFAICVAEHVGGFEFTLAELGFKAWCLWTLADADRDGLGELVADPFHGDTFEVSLYESPDSLSFPTRLAWTSDSILHLMSARHAAVTDLDADSALEVVLPSLHLTYGGVDVYENVGDDEYALRASVPGELDWSYTNPTETFDLDRDGLPELAAGVGYYVNFFEAVGNDTFVSLGLLQLGAVGGGVTGITATPDLDHDGRPEVFAVVTENMGGWTKLAVIESPGDNQFEVTWDSLLTGGGFTGNVVTGDVDGDSIPEIALSYSGDVCLFRCTGSDRYEAVWRDTASYYPVALHDIDGDGADELIHRMLDSTGRYEWLAIRRYVSLGIAEREAARLHAVEVSPSVLRPGARLNLSGLPPDARVELLDVSGRVRTSPDLSLGIRDLPLRPGAYFLRISSGRASTTRKLLVVD